MLIVSRLHTNCWDLEAGYFSRYSDSLRAKLSEVRIQVVRLSAPEEIDPQTHPASDTTRIGSLPGVKRPGRGVAWRGVDHQTPSSAKVKEKVELHLYSPSGISLAVLWWTLPLLYCYLMVYGANIYRNYPITAPLWGIRAAQATAQRNWAWCKPGVRKRSLRCLTYRN
jgi:hypothetical protein